MRVAIFAVSLLCICGARVSHAQLQTAEGGTLTGAVPSVSLNNPSFGVPELTVPAVAAKGAKGLRHGINSIAVTRGVNVRSVGPVPPSPLAAPALRLPLRAVNTRAGGVGTSVARALPAARQSRSMSDHLLAGAVGFMLIAYQLRRKHRVLRPHPFTT